MSDLDLMNRRELLQRVAVLMGGAISAPAVLGILNGCTAKQSASWQPLFLSKEEGAMVEEVAELILPRTTTAGAREVGVPAFIDVILKDAYPAEDQARFISGLKDFDAEAQRAQGKPILEFRRRSASRTCSRCTMPPRLPRSSRRTTMSPRASASVRSC